MPGIIGCAGCTTEAGGAIDEKKGSAGIIAGGGMPVGAGGGIGE